MKRLIIIALSGLLLYGCNGSNTNNRSGDSKMNADTGRPAGSTGGTSIKPVTGSSDTSIQTDRMSNPLKDSTPLKSK